VTGSNSSKYRHCQKHSISYTYENGATANNVGIQVIIKAINILNVSQKKT